MIQSAKILHDIGRAFYRVRLKPVAFLFQTINYYLHNSYIPSSCEIGPRSLFAYGGIGVVIHARSTIGSHCLIGQGVTIGGRNGIYGVPTIEDNVYLGAGARVVGDVHIGHDCIIAPNAVVLRDVEPYSVVAGVPARLIGQITQATFEAKYRHYYGPLNYLGEVGGDEPAPREVSGTAPPPHGTGTPPR